MVGTANVFDVVRAAAGQIERVVYVSSAAVFGAPGLYPPGPIKDDAPAHPATHYGVYKVANEETARIYWPVRSASTTSRVSSTASGWTRSSWRSSYRPELLERGVRQRTRTVTTTDMPARSVCGLPIPFPSRWIRTGTRWTTFTQLPVAFSGGKSEKRAPVPALIESIVPV